MSKPPRGPAAPNKIHRRPLVAALMARRKGAIVVPGLGSPNWDLCAAGDSHDYAYSWGGMGLALPTALGLALAQPGRRILCLTGDGELMMGIGSLAVVADQAPRNLGILVIDNEAFSETGRQRGLTGKLVDLCAVARGFGIKETLHITEEGRIDELAAHVFERPGPTFAVAKVAITEDGFALPEKDGVVIAHRIRDSLGIKGP